MSRLIKKEIFIVFFCLIIGFALRFYTFDQKSLWVDEVHTFNDSRYGIKSHLTYFKEQPLDYTHPPLFFLLTHLFFPFEKPERDLRIIPLISGTLSIPMIYFLAKQFSPSIAFHCAISLTFMTYHISFSQDGRCYALLMFLGIAGLYFLIKHLATFKKTFLFLSAIFYVISFYTSYSFIPFIAFSQLFWFYFSKYNSIKKFFSTIFIFNLLIFLFCVPWVLYLAINYKKQITEISFTEGDIGSLWSIFSNLFNDWVPLIPLTTVSIILLFLYPFFSKERKKPLVLIGTFILPVISLYLFCRFFNIQHYFSSRYLINFLPLFFVTIYLSLDTIGVKFVNSKKPLNLKLLFLFLFLFTNMMILPLYYRSEKQDFRGLVSYLNGHIRNGDKIFSFSPAYIIGMLHYFKVHPQSRHHNFPFYWITPDKEIYETKIPLVIENRKFTIFFSNAPLTKYLEDGSRLWIVAGKPAAKEIKNKYPCVFKGYFDGTFSNFRKFPSDASLYLFLWDPNSLAEKGTDLPIELLKD